LIIYETINIYQTIIIYDKNNYKYDIYKLIKILSSKDYPICMVDNYTEDIQKKKKINLESLLWIVIHF
jgi:hypothetical protein